MPQKIPIGLYIFFTLCVFTYNAPWVIERWLANKSNIVGLFLFVIGLWSLYKYKIFSTRNKKRNISYALLASGLFISMFLLPYNILKAIAGLWSILFGGLSLFSVSKKRTLHLLIWSFVSLPVIPLLGSTVGMLNRILYTQAISLPMSPNMVVGTALHDGAYRFAIDAGCSGVLGFYLLTGLWTLLAWKKEKNDLTALAKTLLLFWGLNTLRVVFLYVLHNKFHIDSLDILDSTLGIFFFALSILFLYTRKAESITHKNHGNKSI